MLILPLVLTCLILTILFVRLLYLRYIQSCWQETCAIYVMRNNESQAQLAKYLSMWPMWQMVLTAHEWDFRAFIKDQDSMNKILTFFRNPVSIES